MNITTSRFRALPLLGAGLVTALVAGCSNGLQSTTPASGDPELTVPPSSSAAAPSPSASASDAPTTAEGSSPSASTSSSPSTQVDQSEARTSAPSDRCRLSNLSIGVREADGGGAAGSSYVLITFRNTGSTGCSLYGYPGVSFVGKGNGTQLGVPAVRNRGVSSSTVKLPADGTTTALLQIANAGNYDATTCAPTTADGFRVYPPGSTTSAYVRFPAQACQRDPGSSKQLTISPVGTAG